MTAASWHRRCAAAAAVALAAVPASAQTSGDEAAVRATLTQCVDAWNRHDPAGFGSACLTDDVWFSEDNDSFYKRWRGRAQVLGLFDYNIRNSELQWEVMRIRLLPDGTVAVQLKQRIGILPRTGDRYAQVFNSDPAFARLRSDEGAWKVFFFTSHGGWARSLLEALDQPLPAAATSPASAAAPSAANAHVPPGTEPPAYLVQFGSLSNSCFHCHGRRPTLSEDGDRGRIVASGAAAADAAALRRAMTTPRAGGTMDAVLADPALSDERLDTIRLWLRAMRDGRAERRADRVLIHNPRSERDPPARLAMVSAEGAWKLPRHTSCRRGATLSGGASCEIRLQPGSRGTLVFRFATSEGLQPQEVRLALDEP